MSVLGERSGKYAAVTCTVLMDGYMLLVLNWRLPVSVAPLAETASCRIGPMNAYEFAQRLERKARGFVEMLDLID